MKSAEWVLGLCLLIFFNGVRPAFGQDKKDITAPQWGPYSKKYAGLSHIADPDLGIRFDFTVVTGYYRGKLVVPNHLFVSDFHPWNTSVDLNHFSMRQEIAWKDKIYSDISFSRITDNARLVRITLHNNTPDLQSLGVNLLAGLSYPEVNGTEVLLPAGRKWLAGTAYKALNYTTPRYDDNLRPDGLRKGEKRSSQFIKGSALADRFGNEPGDLVSYSLELPAYGNALFVLRHRIAAGNTALLKIVWQKHVDTISLKGSGKMEQYLLPLGKLPAGNHHFQILSLSNTPVELDGYTVLEKEELAGLKFLRPEQPFIPALTKGQNSMTLKYAGLKQYYGLAWNTKEECIFREIHGKELDVSLRKVAGDNVYATEAEKKDGHYANAFIRPVTIAPFSTKTIYAMVCEGSEPEVAALTKNFVKNEINPALTKEPVEVPPPVNQEGEPYLFSRERLKAVLLQNVVYPIYNTGEYTRHFTPGKRWNSLYTWDSGFIGLGMVEIDVQRAIESLQTYTTDNADPNAFVQHGSLVPVQFFLYQELWQKTQSEELLRYFYPRLRKYYLFYTGQAGSSTLKDLKSGLLRPFDYFYNSGGWDDYPAQEFMHHQQLGKFVTPVINTAMAIRIAKIMVMAAEIGKIKDDIRGYEQDIAIFTKAIQENSWDKPAGYFGYVVHDPATGMPAGILKTPEGENYNKGFDGIYPLIAGICSQEQKKLAMERLFSPQRLWTSVGISAVDQSATYFNKNGYWNGAVWFPHQWFAWKTMLDLGEGTKAAKIAKTALDLYKKETDSTYNCYEIFRIQTGHGNGWHQFSGLSSPILNWFTAYFKPGTITTGFNSWITQQQFNKDRPFLQATLITRMAEVEQTLLVCMPSGKKYNVQVNNKTTPYKESIPGALEITVPGSKKIEITITSQHL